MAQDHDDPFAKWRVAEPTSDPFAKWRVPEEKKSAFGSIKQGAGEGVGDLKSMAGMLLHPIDTVKGLASGAVEAVKAIPDVARNMAPLGGQWGGFAAKSTTRDASMQGFAEGASGMDIKDIKSDPLRAGSRMMVNTVLPAVVLKGAPRIVRGALRPKATGAAVGGLETAQEMGARLQQTNPAKQVRQVERAGKFTTTQPEISTSRIPYRAPDAAPALSPNAGGRLVKTPADPLVKAVEGARVDLTPRPQSAGFTPDTPQPWVTVGKGRKTPKKKVAADAEAAPKASESPVARREAPQTVGREGDGASAPVTTAPALEASVARPVEGSARPKIVGATGARGSAFAAAEGRAPVATQTLKDWVQSKYAGQRVTYDQIAKDLRNEFGSEKAGRMLGIGGDEVKKLAPGPSQTPRAAEAAMQDAKYRNALGNERGAVDPKLALKMGLPVAGAVGGSMMFDENPLGGAIAGGLTGLAAANPAATAKRFQELRMMGMLSGLALPKSVLGNIGAHVTMAAERGSMAPIKEMLRLPTNIRTAAKAFSEQPGKISASTGVAPVEGLGRLNMPGRVMGAMDDASTASLQRAGGSLDDAQRVLLTSENPVGAGSTLNSALNTRLGRFLVPFQRIPVNAFGEGVSSLEGLLPKTGKLPEIHTSGRGRALTAGAIGGGALAANETENPAYLALLAALMGPRSLPFALGAGAVAGPRVAEGIGVGLPEGNLRDLYEPTRSIDKPALIRALEMLQGKK